MNLDTEISSLEGFLKAIEISASRRARVSANWFPAVNGPTEDLTAFFRQRNIASQSLEATSVTREEFLTETWSYTTDLVAGAPPSVIADFKWQFEELIDLVSASLDSSAQICALAHHPLSRCAASGDPKRTVLLVSFKEATLALFLEHRA